MDQFTATEWTRSTACAKRVSPKSLRPAGALCRRVSRVAEKEGEEGEKELCVAVEEELEEAMEEEGSSAVEKNAAVAAYDLPCFSGRNM